jgi:hypothetical protein
MATLTGEAPRLLSTGMASCSERTATVRVFIVGLIAINGIQTY